MENTSDIHLENDLQCEFQLNNVLDALYVLNGKWKIALIVLLLDSPKRFNEIQAELTTISAKVLAKELKDLELNGFIVRNVYPVPSGYIVYGATQYSRTLKNLIKELCSWGGLHREHIKKSMRR